MLGLIYLYLDVILDLYEQNKITHEDFCRYVDLLHDEMRGES